MDLEARRTHNLSLLEATLPSGDPAEYFIKPHVGFNFSVEDRFYKKQWLLTLLREYDCRCAACGNDSNSIKPVRLFLPKSKGGGFKLRSTVGSQNNAVPLCTSCSRKKQNNTLKFSDVAVATIAFANWNMTARIQGANSNNLVVQHYINLIKSSVDDIAVAASCKDSRIRYLASEVQCGNLDAAGQLLRRIDEYCFAVATDPVDRIYPRRDGTSYHTLGEVAKGPVLIGIG